MSIRGSKRFGSSRGTVSLVALCFVAVLGISLASYIAVCSRAMTLSNRSFQGNLSRQLAEVGIEEALRAFNKNDWSNWTSVPTGMTSSAWTLDTTNKRATRTITFDPTKLGQGTSATIKIRVDNYDAAHLGANWNSSTDYRVNDLVGRNGIWYRCVRNHTTTQTPSGMTNMGYWVPEPISSIWDSTITYKTQDVVYYTSTNTWYRCILAPTSNQAPSNSTYWTSISKISVDNGYNSNSGEVLNYFGTWYYYSGGWRSTPNPPNSYSPVVSWTWRQSYNYSFNDLVCYGYPAVWYRCKVAHTSNGSVLPTNTTYWENALVGMWGWNSGSLKYNLGDAVYYNNTSQWYRCIKAHTSSGSITPASVDYWSNTPLYSTVWESSKRYAQNDTVRHNGVWYLSLQNSNINQDPETDSDSSHWIGANTSNSSYTWNTTSNYSVGNYRCYGGAWYRCTATHTNKSPNDTGYWAAAWSNSWSVTTGTPVVFVEATVTISNNPSLKTQLRAPIAPSPLFPNAAAATTSLTITTGTGTVDSYDSNAAAYNAGTASHSAVLAAGTTLAINGTTAVKGYLAWPSPPAGISTGTTVKGASSPASPNMDLSRVSRSPYIPQFEILPLGGLQNAYSNNDFPRGTLLADNPSGIVTIGTPGATTPSRYYYNGTLQIGTGYPMTRLNINGPVILYVSAYLRIESGGIVDIASTGSAEIHIGGLFRAYSASSGIVNRTLDPKKLILLIDGSASADTYLANTTNQDFYGVIYAPNITHAIGQEIGTGINLYGAISAREITFSSEAEIHYDTSLRYATIGGVDQPYAVTEWRELPITEQATMP